MAGALKTRAERERSGRMVLMAIATGVCAVLAPLGLVGALFSPLVFDERGNLLNPLAWLGFLLMISFWIVCIVAPFVAWVLFMVVKAMNRLKKPAPPAAPAAPPREQILLEEIRDLLAKRA